MVRAFQENAKGEMFREELRRHSRGGDVGPRKFERGRATVSKIVRLRGRSLFLK
jgi:hypothetical protein